MKRLRVRIPPYVQLVGIFYHIQSKDNDLKYNLMDNMVAPIDAVD